MEQLWDGSKGIPNPLSIDPIIRGAYNPHQRGGGDIIKMQLLNKSDIAGKSSLPNFHFSLMISLISLKITSNEYNYQVCSRTICA